MLPNKIKTIKTKRIASNIKKAYYGSTPLTTVFPGMSQTNSNVQQKWTAPKLQVVDGVKVVTIDANIPHSSISLSFTGGSRVETSKNAGVAALVKHLAFKATPSHTQVGLTRGIELSTGSFNSSVSREDISYNAKVARHQLNEFIPFLGEISRPKIREFEIRAQEASLIAQSTALTKCNKTVLVDRLHRVAFRGNGLGRSISPLHSRASLGAEGWRAAARDYVDNYFVKERAVVVVSSISAEEVAPIISKTFANLPSGKNEAPKSVKYQGGEHFGDKGGKTHILLGFEGLPLVSPQLHALNVVYTILGGGVKDSHEGPGNGQGSLLNRNVVEKLSNVYAASSFNASYRDTGLFGIYVQANGEIASTVDNVVDQIHSVLKVSASQFESAKKQLKINLATYYDTTDKRVELSKRFVVAGADPVCFQTFYQAVDKVTIDDVKSVAKAVFSSKPTLVVEGDLEGVPGSDKIASKIGKL